MLEQGLVKKQFVGRDGFFWWIGQVVDSAKWKDNSPALPIKDLPGMKRRVKVRIMGYHTAQVKELTDDDLPWAYCMMPVTAGGNMGGMSQSVNFSGGEWVFGFMLDGEDAQQPVVMGVLDKSSQLTFPKSIPDVGFQAFSGFTNGLVESQNNIKEDGAPAESDPTSQSVPVKSAGVKVKQTLATEGAQLESVRQDIPDHGTKAAHENAKNTGEVKPAQACADDNPQAGIKLALTRLQKQMAFLEEQQGIFLDPLAQKLGDIQGEIERATQNVNGYVKDIMDKVRAVALTETAKKMAEVSINLPIDAMGGFKDKLDEALEGLGCLFENVIGGLNETLNSLLDDIKDKVTGVLDCIVNDVIGGMLDSALGAVNSIMNSITGIFDSLIGGLGDGLGGLIGKIQIPLIAAQDFISSLKQLFSCQEETECADIAQANMLSGNASEEPGDFLGMISSALGGGSIFPEPIGGLLDTAEGIRDSVTGVVDAATGLVNNVESAIDNVSNTIETVAGIPGQALEGLKACNPFAEECQPPLAAIFGGGTTVAKANTIINQAGRVIGVDLNGSEVTNRIFNAVPSINIKSNCGQGGGASARVILNDDGSIDKVQILKPGTNFPPAPDGSIGGNGGTYCPGDFCVVRTPDGSSTKLKPGSDVTIPPNTVVYIPKGSDLILPNGAEDENGNPTPGLQPGRGLTLGNGFFIPEEYSFRAPKPTDEATVPADDITSELEPELDEAEVSGLIYPVVMELDEIDVTKTGVSFNAGDTITVSGDGNELTFEPTLSTNGSILAVRIPEDQRGQGFTDIPDIRINTSTGAGALLTPILRVKYRGRDNINEVIDSVRQDQIITVINCVGAKPVGFVDGQPYYGPFHVHNGRKMVGERHSSIPHSFIEDTPRLESPERSTRERRRSRTITPASGGGGGGLPIASTPASSTTPTPAPSPSPMPAPASPSPSPAPAPAPSPTPTPAPSPSPSPSPGGGGYSPGY